MVTRTRALRGLTAAVVCAGMGVGVSACGGSSSTGSSAAGSSSKGAPAGPTAPGGVGSVSDPINVGAYNKVVLAAPVADSATVSANPWASKIKKQGYLSFGGTDQNPLFDLLDIGTGQLTGFDAGMAQMLGRYITGGSDVKSLAKITNATTDTRETLLQNHSVDAVIETYTITPARAKKVTFAGPYYSSGDSIMVKASNNSIKDVADLKGKTVATEQNSSAIPILQKYAPQAKVQLFQTNDECVAAVQQGRVDAYVLDQSILLSAASTNKAVKVVGKPFAAQEYGIGVPKDEPAAKQFVNAWLKKIIADGTWAKLWKVTIGTVLKGNPPTPPAVGS